MRKSWINDINFQSFYLDTNTPDVDKIIKNNYYVKPDPSDKIIKPKPPKKNPPTLPGFPEKKTNNNKKEEKSKENSSKMKQLNQKSNRLYYSDPKGERVYYKKFTTSDIISYQKLVDKEIENGKNLEKKIEEAIGKNRKQIKALKEQKVDNKKKIEEIEKSSIIIFF